jgi:NCS1 family nucleobase:cation symporter-1
MTSDPIFVEVTEDLSASPLWNPDLAPTPLARRTWSTYHIAALCIGMSVVITTYTRASGLRQQGMTWWQAMMTILLGNVIVLLPMILNAHAGTKYGVSFPVLCRASFGVRGANIPAILRALVACGWFGIQTWIGALALNTLLVAAWPAWAGIAAGIWISFAIFWAIQVWIIVNGLEGIKKLEGSSAPLLLGGGALLLGWAIVRGGGLGHILSESVRLQQTHALLRLPAALTANVGAGRHQPTHDHPAQPRSRRRAGARLLPATMTALRSSAWDQHGRAVGEAIWDPVASSRGSVTRPSLLGALMSCSQLNILAANVVSPANDFSSLSPRRISYVTGGLITAVIGIAMLPWKLYADAAAYIFTWLIGYSSLMGAIGGILIADYWVLRRRELSTVDLFKLEGRYTYSRGVNPRAVIALVLAVLPVVPGFLRAATTPGGQIANPTFLDSLYTYAWFVTFGLSFVLYLMMARRDR